MDAATIKFHQHVLRLAKGILGAYETWLSEQTVEALAAQLKQERGVSTRSASLAIPQKKL